MPSYDFYNDETGRIVTVYVPLDAPDEQRHLFKEEDTGLIYTRVYEAPNAAIDSIATDTSESEFRRITSKPNMTIGEVTKISQEMSAARAEKNGGVDPVKERYHKSFERRNGCKSESEKTAARRNAVDKQVKELSKIGIKITDA